MSLILFDVDGTLLKAGRQVRQIFAAALREVYGETGDLDSYDFRGKTDPLIVRELLTGIGRDPEEVRRRLPEVRRQYLTRLERDLDAGKMRILPGVEETLEDLVRRDDLAIGLLTGNWQSGAWIKLGRLGLDRFFTVGAFGCDANDRADLPPRAWERAEREFGRPFDSDTTWIVGDSTEDVRCGRAHGIPVIGVTTGWTSGKELSRAGAREVIEGLSRLPALLPGPGTTPASGTGRSGGIPSPDRTIL
ncbi:MAG: HAD family hydrolase [Thermoanaerobaculia bacterium]|nr:HAD family hydrolase [Thermoanaerobaculia bacterium]